MSNPIVVERESVVDVTPEKLAEWFCAMDSGQQATFFDAIGAECERIDLEMWQRRANKDRRAAGYLGMEWQLMSVSDQIRKRSRCERGTGRWAVMTLAASCFLHSHPDLEWSPSR